MNLIIWTFCAESSLLGLIDIFWLNHISLYWAEFIMLYQKVLYVVESFESCLIFLWRVSIFVSSNCFCWIWLGLFYTGCAYVCRRCSTYSYVCRKYRVIFSDSLENNDNVKVSIKNIIIGALFISRELMGRQRRDQEITLYSGRKQLPHIHKPYHHLIFIKREPS